MDYLFDDNHCKLNTEFIRTCPFGKLLYACSDNFVFHNTFAFSAIASGSVKFTLVISGSSFSSTRTRCFVLETNCSNLFVACEIFNPCPVLIEACALVVNITRSMSVARVRALRICCCANCMK